MDWTPEKIVFSVDGVEHYTYNPAVKDEDTWPYDHDHYLLMNIAIQNTIDPEFTQSPMEIDYVRVYDMGVISGIPPKVQDRFRVYPNPAGAYTAIWFSCTGSADAEIRLVGLDGTLVKTFPPSRGDHETILDLSGVREGMYLLRVTGEGKSNTVKLIKIRTL
jgi:beta-glucanase (GH16 family)